MSRLISAVSKGFRNDNGGFEFNKDAGMFVCLAGHMAIRKAIQGKKGEGYCRSIILF